MRCRATMVGSVGLCLILGLSAAGAQVQSGRTERVLSVPPLTAAEIEAAYAPVSGSLDRPPSPSAADETAALARGADPLGPRAAPVQPGLSGPDLAAAAAVPSSPAALGRGSPDTDAAADVEAVSPRLSDVPEAYPAPAAGAMPPSASALALSDGVRAVLADRLSRADLRDAAQAALATFYALRSNQPVWTADGVLSPIGQAVLERMARAEEDGLDPRAYGVDTNALSGPEAVADKVADAELAIGAAVLTYIQHAANGRVNMRSIGRDILRADNAPPRVVALASVVIAADPAAVLGGFNPSHPQYLALRSKLAEIRENAAAIAAAEPPRVPGGPVLRVGMSDARVAVLRTRLGLTMTDGDIYDDAVAEAVRSFQKQRRIKPTGTLGPQTVAALNGGLRKRRFSTEHEIISNMERWRWLPRDLGASNVFVNIPEFRLRVMRDGSPIHEAKVIVGKPNTPTPVFSDEMQFVVLNPSWNVPQSIIRNEYLPKLMEDPDYLARRGFIVTYRGNRISVRQPPGEANALGHIKFMFPNNFSVYLHDTSSRGLFANEMRAFSHGCVRVDDPYEFAEIVMGAQHGWTAERVRKMVGKREQRVDLKEKIPVHITYFTARVDEAGDLKMFEDIYGYDHRVLSALGLSG
jgi:murein L,D-transpeptidase YcbB/YkuD